MYCLACPIHSAAVSQIWQLLTYKKSAIEGLPTWAVDWLDQDGNHRLVNLENEIVAPGWAGTGRTTKITYSNGTHARGGPFNVVLAMDRSFKDVDNAAGTTDAATRLVEPFRKMAVRGLVIGTIDADSASDKCVTSLDDHEIAFENDFESVMPLIWRSERSPIDTVFQLGSCLLFDGRTFYADANTGEFVKFVGNHLLDVGLACSCASLLLRSKFGDALNSIALTCREESKVDRLPDKITQAVDPVLESKRMRQSIKKNFWDSFWIWNKEFDLLNLAPLNARKGDMLFVPYGCPFVMVLHDEGDSTFTVVGPCWLYGFMNGEAIKKHADGIIEESEVVLV